MVFGVGLGRTGTTSLKDALQHLGYNCLHNSKKVSAAVKQDRELSRPLLYDLVGEYNAFVDYPIWTLYQTLDEAYPNSKFIWTVRDLPSWLVSRKFMIEYRLVRIRKGKMDVPSLTEYHEEDQRKIYLKHHAEVSRYFQGRERDLLVLDLSKGQSWHKLCSFLEKSIPTIPFPHVNRTEDKPH